MPTFPPRYHQPIGNTTLEFLPLPPQMPNYRRVYIPGRAVFLTLVTFDRRSIFAKTDDVRRLRQAAIAVKAEMPLRLRGRGWWWVN